MKKFVFRYTPLIWILLIVVAVIFAAAIAVNVYDAINFFAVNNVKFVFAVIFSVFSAVLLFLTLSAIIYGRYVIKGKYLYFRFGIFFTKTDITDIFQLTEFKAQNKLVMYFKDEKYSVAVISEKNYAAFYAALKAVNPAVIYTVQSADE